MIRRAFVLMLSTLALATMPAFAQRPAQSPSATASVTVGGKALTIRYSAPSVRNRKIFGAGGLLSMDPTYPVWRAGANDATTFQTDADLTIGTLNVPKGTYTLYVLVRDENAWQLILNKQTGQWGLMYDQARDLGRAPMTMSRPAAKVEQLKYTLTDKGAGKAELQLAWENHVATVPITVK